LNKKIVGNVQKVVIPNGVRPACRSMAQAENLKTHKLWKSRVCLPGFAGQAGFVVPPRNDVGILLFGHPRIKIIPTLSW